MSRPILYAHRGAAAELPENTLPSFVRALELGADALETDVHMTSDGVIVVSHDDTGARMAGVGRAIREHTYADVRSWDVGFGFRDARGDRPFAKRGFVMPTLEQLLIELAPVTFNVDAKQRRPDITDALIRVIRTSRAEERVQLASFDSATLRNVRAKRYRGPTGLGQSEVIRLYFQPEWTLRALPLGGTAAQLPTHVGTLRLDRPALVDKCHALGIRVDYWTINDVDEARRLIALGADGIMTDDPRKLAPLFAELKERPS